MQGLVLNLAMLVSVVLWAISPGGRCPVLCRVTPEASHAGLQSRSMCKESIRVGYQRPVKMYPGFVEQHVPVGTCRFVMAFLAW